MLDIRGQEFDYIFYQRPYKELLPKELRAQNVIDFCKPCYIPYAFVGAKVFEELALFNAASSFYAGNYKHYGWRILSRGNMVCRQLL